MIPLLFHPSADGARQLAQGLNAWALVDYEPAAGVVRRKEDR